MKTNETSLVAKRFNYHFSKSGWIAHESMNGFLLDKCATLAEKGNINEAEELLTEHFTAIKLDWLEHKFNILPVFSKKHKAIELAYQDGLTGYYAISFRLLVFILDVILKDLEKEYKGLFTMHTSLKEWGNIASQSTALTELYTIFKTTRNKWTKELYTNEVSSEITKTEPILEDFFMPYQNGLCGFKPNYKYNHAKAWALLIIYFDYFKKWTMRL